MKPDAHPTFAEQAGRTLGRMWREFVRLDRKAHERIVAQGWGLGAASVIQLVIKLVVMGVLTYLALWLAVLIVLLGLSAWSMCGSAVRDTEDKNEPEWREGHDGFGLYDRNEWRHDMGDPDKR